MPASCRGQATGDDTTRDAVALPTWRQASGDDPTWGRANVCLRLVGDRLREMTLLGVALTCTCVLSGAGSGR